MKCWSLNSTLLSCHHISAFIASGRYAYFNWPLSCLTFSFFPALLLYLLIRGRRNARTRNQVFTRGPSIWKKNYKEGCVYYMYVCVLLNWNINLYPFGENMPICKTELSLSLELTCIWFKIEGRQKPKYVLESLPSSAESKFKKKQQY